MSKSIDKLKNIKYKKELGLYLNTNFIFSYDWEIQNMVILSPRGVGKTVIGVETIIQLKNKYGWDNVKAFYFRTTEASQKALLMNNAEKSVDGYLLNKYNMSITAKGNKVFDHGRLLFETFALTTAGNLGRGLNLYDCNFFQDDKKKFIVTLWDEILPDDLAQAKRPSGSQVAQYRAFREEIFRDQEPPTFHGEKYHAIYNFLFGNNCSEIAPVTGTLWGYIPKPGNHDRVVLRRKNTMIWNMPITKAYVNKRKGGVNASVQDLENDPNYKEVEQDLSLIKPKRTRLVKVTTLYKFGKDKNSWFCLYDGKYIRKYRKEYVDKNLVVAMRRYLDEIFCQDVYNSVIARNDFKGFMFADIMSMMLWQSEMQRLKSK